MTNRVRAAACVAVAFSLSASGTLFGSENGTQPQAGSPMAGLYLRAGTVDTRKPELTIPAAIGARPEGKHFVVQLDGPITPDRRARLAGAGVHLGDYLPSNAYIATLDGADARAAAGLEFVRWVGEYQSAWKLDPELGQRMYSTGERQGLQRKGRDLYSVVVFLGADAGTVQRAIWTIPGALIRDEQQIAGHVELQVEGASADPARMALIPGVQFIEPAPEVTPRSNLTTRWIVQSNQSGLTPVYAAGIHGEGQIVGILDGRVDINHCSFKDTTGAPVGPTHRKVVGMLSTGTADTHGTHVSGIAAGDAGAEDNTRGVAYLGKLSWASYNLTASTFTTNATWNRNNGTRIHTNSWGNDGTTSYDALCRAIDDFTFTNEDDVVCFAVTNQTLLKNPENAKNVVAVGNTGDTPNQNTVCTGGAGPTSDGRRKPEIWAPGCSTLSSQSGSACGTVALTGTSMASPAIAGSSMLIRQYYTDGYYPLGVASGTGFTPSAALIRATLMNSGQDMAPAGYPSAAEGWGRVKLNDVLYFPGGARNILVKDVPERSGLATGAIDTTSISVLGSAQQLRITVAWTEPPGTAGAANPVVNDLDLEVVDPLGATYLGNVFNTTTGQSQTGGTKDPKNIIEQVHVVNPPAGQWTVRVKGGAVAQGTQGFALVATGQIQGGSPPPLVINLPSGTPGLIAPNTPTNIDVQVIPGSQTVVAGSPAMLYRSTAGSFTSQPLTSLGGNNYRATIPAAQCSDTPQYYFTASGSGGAVANLPANAPTGYYSSVIGTVQTTTVFSADLASTLPAGWSATGLWHVSGTCAPSGTPCSGNQWAYYGQDSTCTFNTGVANTGMLTLPPISIPAVPPGGDITLSYCSALVTEANASYDKASVLVNGVEVDRAAESNGWETRTVNLTSYAGQTVTIAYSFDSVDATLNDFRGWHVNHFNIRASSLGCASTCYANCDGSTAPPILNVNDFVCFTNLYAAGSSAANCDGSTAPPVLNVNDFVCFNNRYAAGCP